MLRCLLLFTLSVLTTASFGISGFHGFLETTAPSYPNFAPLPGIRNSEYIVGTDLLLASNGFVIDQTHSYLVIINAYLMNQDDENATNCQFNVFAAPNSEFNASVTNVVMSSNSLCKGCEMLYSATSILLLNRGDTLSLFINNGCQPDEYDYLALYAWSLIVITLA